MRTPVTSIERVLGRRSRHEPDSSRLLRRLQAVTPPTPGGIAGATAPSGEDTRMLAHLDVERVRWEANVSRVMTALSLMAILLAIALTPVLGVRMMLALGMSALATAAYFGICWQLLSNARRLPRWAPWVNATLEASLGTVALLVVYSFKGSAWALTSSLAVLYPLAILVSSARMRPRICLYVAVLCATEFVLLYHLLLRPELSSELIAALPTLDTWSAWERAFWLLCVGGVGAFTSHKIRALMVFGGAQASERQWLETEFGRYVSKDVAHAILRGEAGVGKAERREVTVLFCDLRNFTSLCEREPPETVVAILNAFFAQVCKVIEAHGGTVNKFLGDGVLALFGAPDEHPNHARAAAEAAHDILAVADQLRQDTGLASFDVGIGLDTGDVVVGAIGSPDRVEYTAIGSAVNRAARLQGLSSKGRHRIVMSRVTVGQLGPNANVISLGDVSLKGFAAPEPVFAFRHA